MTATEPTLSEVKSILHKSLQTLAGVCDGAVTIDDKGFNGGDSSWGKQMANSDPEKWSGRAVFCVFRLLRKYKKQLLSYGIALDLLPDLSTQLAVDNLIAASRPVASTSPIPAAPKSARRISAMPDNHYRVEFPYDAGLVQVIKALPRNCREFNADDSGKYWIVNFNTDSFEVKAAAVVFWNLITRAQFDIPEEIVLKLAEFSTEAIQMQDKMALNHDTSMAIDAEIVIPGLKGELRPFQRGGVAYAARNKRLFLADDMGLGKTVQALATAELTGAFPALVVCRSNLRQGWVREVNNFLPHRSVSVSPFNKVADIVVVSHRDAIKASADLIARGFRTVIGDECQDFKHSRSQRTKALKKIAKDSKAEYRMLLSGTPLTNRPAELVSQLDILDRLNEFGGFYEFAYRYCGGQQGRFGFEMKGATNSEELNNKLRSLCMIRRLKSQVLTELPDKVRDVIEVELDNRAEYDASEVEVEKSIQALTENFADEREMIQARLDVMGIDELIEYAQEIAPALRKRDILAWKQDNAVESVMGFIKARLDSKESSIENASAIMLMQRLMRVSAMGKVAAFKEWYDESGIQKIVVFARSAPVQAKLAEMFPSFVWTRDAKWENPQAAVDHFANNPECPGIICSLMGDNAGLNGMQCAQYVAFIDMDFVPSTMEQAEDRLHRIGQKGSVNAYYFHAKDTIDSDIWELLQGKWEIMRSILNGKATEKTGLSIARELFERMSKK